MEHIARYLTRLIAWMRPVEARLRACEWPEELSMDERCRKAEWIAEDLARLGATDEADAPEEELPACEGPARWGVAYVLEGATLGGLVIQRRVPHAASLRFFRGYGDDTKVRWNTFRDCLEVAGRAAPDIVIGSAMETFEGLHQWLGR